MKKVLKYNAVLLLTCLLIVISGMTANAASTKKKALKAYKQFLSKKTIMVLKKNKVLWPSERKYKGTKASKVRFALAYLDGDSVPELVVYAPVPQQNSMPAGAIYCYKNRKVKKVCELSEPKGYYYKKGLFTDYSDVEGYIFVTRYYKYSSGKASRFIQKDYYPYYEDDEDDEYDDEYDDEETTYYQRTDYTMCATGKSITTAKFKSLLSGCTKGAKWQSFKFVKNTKKNRKKYLK